MNALIKSISGLLQVIGVAIGVIPLSVLFVGLSPTDFAASRSNAGDSC